MVNLSRLKIVRSHLIKTVTNLQIIDLIFALFYCVWAYGQNIWVETLKTYKYTGNFSAKFCKIFIFIFQILLLSNSAFVPLKTDFKNWLKIKEIFFKKL